MTIALAVLWPLTIFLLAMGVRHAAWNRTVQRRLWGNYDGPQAVWPAEPGQARIGIRERWGQSPAAAALRLRISEYLLFRLVSFLAPFLVGYLLRGLVGGILLGLAGLAGLTVHFRLKQQRWLKDAEEALPEFLRAVSSALRAGSSLSQAMALVADDTSGPMGIEVRRVLRRERLGFSLTETLAELTRRIPSRDLALAVMAITIQREVGGSLADVLDNIVETIVARQRLKSEIRVLTAQGRYSGWLLTVLPFLLGLLMYFTDPSYMGVLVHTRIGGALLGAAVVMIAVGGLVINRLVRAPEN